ncbi:FAD-binding domain [Psychromarinibacter sp. C21-152]|uniref:FAD-binding domain n=1 Tax=Psychromarinibacter sediminicola TaxID=3033385 RepID=A0AAE3NUD9_9RHOB|nr:FAD-binding domain [Psychromarinibacter sediminicola]MDF0601844.1 FAD-binding domain [Psychromarinibacter sediminicola]
MRIGISGAGIAGPTLAWWLERAGHAPTLIERAPALRTGGYIIDFWGAGYTVAERMGLMDRIHARGYRLEELRLVDRHGRRAGGFSADVFHRATGGRFVSLPRGDLAAAIHGDLQRTETVFGRSVAELAPQDDRVGVTLDDGTAHEFDLLVGADGLHSQVRALGWGPQDRYERTLGYYVAAFETAGYPHRDPDVYVSHLAPQRSLSRFSLQGDRTMVLLVFSADLLDGPEPRDAAGRRALLHDVFGGCGWEAPEILRHLDGAEDLYFDRVSQIEIPEWHRGRTVLIGDAAACASLLAGEGTGLAMTEAYVLAAELQRAGADMPAALAAYETRLRDFIAGKQRAARGLASSFAPNSAFAVRLRQLATRLMRVGPLADLMIGRMLRDDVDLPDPGRPAG